MLFFSASVARAIVPKASRESDEFQFHVVAVGVDCKCGCMETFEVKMTSFVWHPEIRMNSCNFNVQIYVFFSTLQEGRC